MISFDKEFDIVRKGLSRLLFMLFVTTLLPASSFGHDTGANKKGVVNIKKGSPVHQFIAREARDVWFGLPSEIDLHISESLFLTLDPWNRVNYDPGYDDIVTGSGDEDQERVQFRVKCHKTKVLPFLTCSGSTTVGDRYTNGFLEHFWDPDEPHMGGFGAYDKGFSDPNLNAGQQFASSYRKAQEFWDKRVLCNYTGVGADGSTCPVDKDQAYWWLGRVVHLLTDLAVPAHVHNVAHDPVSGIILGGRDLFEKFVVSVFADPKYSGSNYQGTEYRHEDLPCIPAQSADTCTALRQNFNWTDVHPNPTGLFKLFWFTAQKTQYYATAGTILGRVGDAGTYVKLDEDPAQFSPSLWEVEGIDPVGVPDDVSSKLQEMTDALIPHALKAVAGLYRLFCLEVGIGPNCAFDYALSDSGDIHVTQGSSGSNTITRALATGLTTSVSLSVSGLPSGASSTFTNNPCDPSCSGILTISTSTSTPAGTFPIVVTGTPLGKTTTFNLVVTAPLPQCSDGVDNDGDGLIDFPSDPGCSSPTDNDERDPPGFIEI